MKTIRFIDLFAGIGGFRYGIERANQSKDAELQIKQKNKCGNNGNKLQGATFNCVWSNEWDKYASSIYKKHYGECDTRDITKVPSSEIPDHDLLVGGFPCQSFSIAGKRKGFNDTRGTLFFEIARILRDKRPRYFLLENVKGLLSHDEGKTFQTILGVLSDLGYELEWQVLNSKNFGVPQNRERVFIVGHLRGQPRPKVFPIAHTNRTTDEGYKQKDTKSEIAQTIRNRHGNGTGSHLEYVGGIIGKRDKWLKDGKDNSRNFSQGQRVYGTKGISSTLAGNAGGLGGKTGLYAIPVLTPDRLKKRQNGRRFKTDGEPSFTLTGQDIHGVMINNPLKGKTKYGWHFEQNVYGKDGITRSLKSTEGSGNKPKVLNDMRIRRLTPTECERLQGFPDGWTEGISDTQRYKCLGNAVTTNVVTEIGRRLQ